MFAQTNLQRRCNTRLVKKKENEPRNSEPTEEKRRWMAGRVRRAVGKRKEGYGELPRLYLHLETAADVGYDGIKKKTASLHSHLIWSLGRCTHKAPSWEIVLQPPGRRKYRHRHRHVGNITRHWKAFMWGRSPIC